MAAADVAILIHEADRLFEKTRYLVHALSAQWRASGLRVETLCGTREAPPAALLLPHIDLTLTPPSYTEFAGRYRRVANRAVTDISKRSFSRNILGPDSPDQGPVIVKTNRNHGGLPELRLDSASRARRFLDGLRRRIGVRTATRRWDRVETLDSDSYCVFPALSEIPREVFGNPNLVVERFLPEIEGGRYAIRYCYALGAREFTVRILSKHPVVKASHSQSCEPVENSSELTELRRGLGLDFGKLDYVLRDGRVVLLDVNSTPAHSALDRFGLTGEVARRLAEGIRDIEA